MIRRSASPSRDTFWAQSWASSVAQLPPVLGAAADLVLEPGQVVGPRPGHDLLDARRRRPRADAPIVTSASAGRGSRASRPEERVAADAEADEDGALEAERAQDVRRCRGRSGRPRLLALVGRAAVARAGRRRRCGSGARAGPRSPPSRTRPCRCRRAGTRSAPPSRARGRRPGRPGTGTHESRPRD